MQQSLISKPSCYKEAVNECLYSIYISKSNWERFVKKHGYLFAYYTRCINAAYQLKHTGPLLATAYIASVSRNESNQKYFYKHYFEEKDHVLWGLNDLKIVKKLVPSNWEVEPSRNILKILDDLYESLRAGDVKYFLGYIVALEGFPSLKSYWILFQKNSNIPVKAFTSPIKHSNLDVHHSLDLFQQIEKNYGFEDRKLIFSFARDIMLRITDFN